MKDKRVFLKMNSDDSPLALPNGDALVILNCRVHPTHLTTTPGLTLIPEPGAFVGVGTYTATCPAGSVGGPVTERVELVSYESQEAAGAEALKQATEKAMGKLVCLAWRPKEDSGYCVQDDGTVSQRPYIDNSFVIPAGMVIPPDTLML